MPETKITVQSFVKVSRARDNQGEGERWSAEQVHPTLNAFDNGDARCVCAVVHEKDEGRRTSYSMGGGQMCELSCRIEEVFHTLNHMNQAPLVAIVSKQGRKCQGV